MSRALFGQSLPYFFALISSTAISFSCNKVPKGTFPEMFRQELNGIGIDKFIVFVALSVLFVKTWDRFLRSAKWITHLLAALFAAFMLIGQSYASLGNWGFIFANGKQFCIASIDFVGYFVLFDLCLSLLYDFLLNSAFAQPSLRVFPDWIERHYMLFAFCVITICWLPYLIAYLPGSLTHDAYRQVNMAFGINKFNNHHPWVLSEVYGVIVWIGRHISDNAGLFLLSLFGFVVQGYCYAFSCYKIRCWGAPFKFCVCTLLYFALLPLWGSYSQAVIKDNIFCALFVLFMVLYIDVCISYTHGKDLKSVPAFLLSLFLVGMAVCLTRNNGIHMILPALMFLFFFLKKGMRRYSFVLVISVALSYFCIESILAPAMGIDKGGVQEMLSLPFQQTARYVKEFPDDVTEDERKAIDAVIAYKELAKRYKPELSDPVKSTAKRDIRKNLTRYFKHAWYPMMLKHPGVYIEALLHKSFGYYYPFSARSVMAAFQFYIKGKPVATGDFDFHYIFSKNVRDIFSHYSESWRIIPGLATVINPGTYAWILLMAAGFMCYCPRYRKLLSLVAPMLNVAVCIASPVNGLMRYAMPLMACTPVIIYWSIEHLIHVKIPSGEKTHLTEAAVEQASDCAL